MATPKREYVKNILIDWLRFTVPMKSLFNFDYLESYQNLHIEILKQVKSMLGIHQDYEFNAMKYGFFGYDTGYALGGISCCWGGNNGTLMVDITGEGCRLLEDLNINLDWLSFIQTLTCYDDYKITRMDVACDTYELLKMTTVFNAVMEERYIQKWNLKPLIKWGREETIMFGSRQSNVVLRIYNKTYERECKSDLNPEDIPKNWVRCEFELKGEACDSFVREWTFRQDISAVYFGLMISHLRFVTQRETNLSRSITAPWWDRFLDNAKPIKLAYKGGLEYNLQKLDDYVIGQAGGSLHAYLKINGGDISGLVERIQTRPINEKQNALVSMYSSLKDNDFGSGCMEKVESKLDFNDYIESYGIDTQLRGRM